jgi:RimJ/RimL family protein N-acetyltransferase
LGVVAGTVAGGVYALTDAFFRRLFRASPRIDLLPFTPDDIDVLLAWVRSPVLLRRWAGGPAAFPSDHDQLQQRLDASAGDHPSRLIFKAISTDSGKMVGYVELGPFDPSLPAALVELSLVAPEAADRDLIGVLLLSKLAEKAFGELGFRQLNVRFDDREGELAACCRRAWARKYDYVDITARDDSGIRYLGILEPRR